MRSTAIIILVVYYSLGTLFLPAGNFHTLGEIPDMYKHCKQTEHCDMNFIEFFTDHLMNIDGMFDDHQGGEDHENGDDQKAHSPFNFQVQQDMAFLPLLLCKLDLKNLMTTESNLFSFKHTCYQSTFISSIFRPPIG